ncbi:7765_t:CDS:2 [Diversispora eburnea]|uniref:7765_t:CDS:1 n=1 Tax=Diversispora eburnea TaxID=1213867 RepID=A0A9N8V5V9_9GLOM|nr:7765_t:CDS:2 [Diversispora eburnea]
MAAADELLLTELVEHSKEYLREFHYKWILQFPFQVLNHTISHLDSCKDLRELSLNTICENPTAALGNKERKVPF